MYKDSQFDVLVIGTTCIDLVFSHMPNWPMLGDQFGVKKFAAHCGAVFNVAATASRLGLRVGLLTILGNDFLSRFILEEIDKAGISRDFVIVQDEPLRAISTCLAYDGDRAIVSYEDIADATLVYLLDALSSEKPTSKQIREKVVALLNTSQFAATYISAQASIGPLLDLLAERQTTIFMDPGGEINNLRDSRLPAVLQRAHVIMPNQREAMYLTNIEEPEGAARKLNEWVNDVIVTVGERGTVACHQGQMIHCPAYPIAEVVDTTGAGDAFCGGFMYGWVKGYTFHDALRCGNICGSLSTTALTGTTAIPTAKQLEIYLQQEPG